MTERETKIGAFETFKSEWLLQVAADKEAKAATPVAIVLCCKNLNRGSGEAWPSIATLMKMTGAGSENTIRNALKILEARGHARIIWTKGGSKNTNHVIPLVAGEPFRKLKGSEVVEPLKNLKGSVHEDKPGIEEKTLQISELEPFKKLKGNHLIEPSEGGPAFEAGTAGSNWVDRIDAREATEAASFARLNGAPDASDDFAYWYDQAGISAAEIDLDSAPEIEMVVTAQDLESIAWKPDLTASFEVHDIYADHESVAMRISKTASADVGKVFGSNSDPVDFWFDLRNSETFTVETGEDAERMVEYLTDDPDLLDREKIRRKLLRLLRVGELTRNAYVEIINGSEASHG